MKAAIVYCSQTGHTEKYARWLADRLGCEATPFSKRASVDLDAIDILVFCSWFHAASIKGSKWLKREMAARPGLDVVLLATGATPMPGTGWSNEEEIEQAFRRSFPKDDYPDLPHFYCHGGYDFEKLGAVDKAAMRMFYKMNEKDADPKTREMLATMRAGFDGTRREYLAPVIEQVQRMGAEGAKRQMNG